MGNFLNAAHNFTHLQLFCSSRYPVFPHKCIIKILFISYFLHIMYAYMSRVFRHWIDCMVLCTYTLPNEYLMNSSGNDIKENWILCFMHIYFEGYWRISNLIFHWRFFVFLCAIRLTHFSRIDWTLHDIWVEVKFLTFLWSAFDEIQVKFDSFFVFLLSFCEIEN